MRPCRPPPCRPTPRHPRPVRARPSRRTCWPRPAPLLDDVVALRRDLHRRPELGLDLPATQARVLEALDGLPLTVTTGERLSSIVADLDGDRPGPTVLLRGDMDALPMPEDTGLDFASEVDGAMHACGHDAHTAMLAGAARLLRGAPRRPRRAGAVLLPARRGGPRRRPHRMLDEGVLDAADGGEAVSWAFAIHQSPSIPSGDGGHQGRADHGLGRRDVRDRPRAGRPRLDAAPRQRPDPGGVRDRPGPADLGHPPGRRLRPRGRHRGPHPGRHDDQRHPRDGPARRHDPHGRPAGAGGGARRGPAHRRARGRRPRHGAPRWRSPTATRSP